MSEDLEREYEVSLSRLLCLHLEVHEGVMWICYYDKDHEGDHCASTNERLAELLKIREGDRE